MVGTTRHASDLAYSKKDLIGRYTQIDLGRWKSIDLKKIPEKGFSYLGRSISHNIIKLLTRRAKRSTQRIVLLDA